ncbi:MAG: type I methionyl aminopeptidase [Bacilli bacterium]
MIVIKSKREIDLMRRAGEIVYETHQLLKKRICVGITTQELDKIAYDYIISCDAKPSFKNYNGFPATLCTSINDQVVHGIPNNYKLKDGDIVSIDIGACYQGYHGDSAWTYEVGSVDLETKRLLKLTEQSLFIGLEQVKPGNRVGDISAAIGDFAKEHNLGVVKELTGHGVGSKLHEDPHIPNYGIKGTGPKLKVGMTLAIEPMLNLGTANINILDDGWTITTSDGKNSAHYEHTIVVTETGYDILTTKMEDLNG